MKTIKIYFVDFWSGFDPIDNFFTKLLSVKYNVIIDPVFPIMSFIHVFHLIL